MKKITSFTAHNTSEGQRLSFTYSVIDENSGQVISDNNRMSIVLLEIERNKDAIASIDNLNQYLLNKISD